MSRYMLKSALALFVALGHCVYAQNLTVSTSGQTGTSGTNWSINGNTLSVTGTANIRASVIQDHMTNTGPLELVGNTTSFVVTVSEAITLATGGNGLVFGVSGNTGSFTVNAAISINGPISIYGGIVTVNQNLTSTASGADILLQANENIVLAAGRTIETNAGDITFRANAGGTPLLSEHAIRLFSGTSLLSNGGNITLGGNYDGTEGTGLYAATNRTGGRAAIVMENATLIAAGGDINVYGRCVSSYDDGILFYGNITTTGSGTIGLYGDAFGGNNGSTYFGGITVWSTTNIESEDGNVTLKGVLTNTQSNSTGSINFYRAQGTASNHISILSKTGDVFISGDAGTTAAWGINHNSGGNIYVGSPVDGSWIATGDIEISYSNLANAAFRGIKVNTTGNVSWVPVGASFTVAQTLPATANYELAQNASSLTIGKPGNTANITIAQAQTINGPIAIYGNAIEINQNLESLAENADILIQSDGGGLGNTNGYITLASGRNLKTNGGDIILWSNAANRFQVTGNSAAENTANNQITLAGTNTLESNGGRIILAGGLDDGGSSSGISGAIANDGIPDGYAYRGGNSGEAIDILSNVTMDSNGGEIIIRGEHNGLGVGVGTDNTFTINNSGEITIEGKSTDNNSIRFGISNINVGNAPVKIYGSTHITNSGLVSITTQGGNVLIASNVNGTDHDGGGAINGQIRMGFGLNITTNGGDITLGGGNTDGTDYAMGQNFNNLPEGIRIDGSVSLNSGGGNIEMRGKTPAVGIASNIGGAGIMFYNIPAGSINSGTGTILLDGYSQASVGNAVAGLLWWSPGASNFTIESANPSANAITLNGFASGASGQAYGVETEAFNTLDILATASGGGITLNTGNSIANYYDAVFRGPLNVLAVDGPIALKGGQLGGVANGYLYFANNVYLGSKASTAVESSSSDILIQFDRFDFPGGSRFIATDGAVTWQPNGATFGMAVNSNFFSWNQNSQTMSGLTIGKLGNTANVTHNIPITVAGPISIYGGGTNIAANLTSSADGDIFIKGNALLAPNGDILVQPGVTIAKTGGTGTLTLQAKSRISNSGSITATAPGVLNVVMWADYENLVTAGMAGSGNITTNGGHVWLGGSSTSGGSYTWNGLTVGDGPSLGSPPYNYSGLDLTGNITTSGGDVFIWAGNGNSAAESGIRSYGKVIDADTGDVTLVTDYVSYLSGNTDVVTTGTLSIVPNGGSFASTFNWNPNISGSYLDFPAGNFDFLRIKDAQNLTGLTIGEYSGMLDGNTPIILGNNSDVNINTATTIAGSITIYGETLAINENLSSSTGSTISLYGNTLNFDSGKTVTSNNGQLIVAPQNPALTIGMAGASGNLSLPASYFSDNFTDGFANIQIGSANQTGAISTNAFNLRDNMTLLTSGNLTLGGKPVLGANNMTLGEDITTIDVGVAQNYFKSDSTGRLKRQISDGNSRFLPIGRAYYNPVTITNNSGSTDVFSAGVLDSVFLNGFVGPLIETPHVKVTWDLDKENANGGNGIQAEFGWFASQEEGTMSSYRLNHHNGSNWEFASGTSNAVSGSSFKTMEHINYIGSFSPFAISEDGSGLPVEFLGIQYECLEQQSVSLTWQTASELNAQHFEVMRSEDGFTWEKVGTVAAKGTTNQLSEYQFVDEKSYRGALLYYQLKQIDLDGEIKWLPIISVNCEREEGIHLYPNPAQSQFVIEFIHEANEPLLVSIFDAIGREVKVEQIAASLGFNRIDINISELPSGTYQLRFDQMINPKPLYLLIKR